MLPTSCIDQMFNFRFYQYGFDWSVEDEVSDVGSSLGALNCIIT